MSASLTYISYTFPGFYLFLQVEAPLHVEVVKLRHYLCIGWGLPILVVGLWSFLTYYLQPEGYGFNHPHTDLQKSYNTSMVFEEFDDLPSISTSNATADVCPFLSVNHETPSEWAYNGPVLLILACNMVFLVYIMTIVICKLKSENVASESHRQHWRAAKALLVIFPLLGISYIITLVVPPQGVTGHRVFQYVRALLLSLQVIYCYIPSFNHLG